MSRRKQPRADFSALTVMEWAAKQAHIKQIVLCIADDSDNTIETVQYNAKDFEGNPWSKRVPVELILNEEHANLKPKQYIAAVRLTTEEGGVIFFHPYLNEVAMKDCLENMREFAPLEKTPVWVAVKRSVN